MIAEGFLRALEAVGADLHVEDVLDALWLATRGRVLTLGSGSAAARQAQPPSAGVAGEQANLESAASADGIAKKKPDPLHDPGKQGLSPPGSLSNTVFPSGRVASNEALVKASPVAVPAGQALPGRLQFARSLRPFRQRWPSRHELELDEERTAELTAELRGQRYLAFRPRRERWFDVALVLEDDPALGAWRDALQEFGQILRDTGAFRDVRIWRLRVSRQEIAGKVAEVALLESPNGGRLPARGLGGLGVRRLIFVASYGASGRWADGSYARLIEHWSSTASVVLLSLLDRRHWKRSVLGDPHGECYALEAGAATADLRVDRYWWSLADESASVCVPIVPLTPQDLGQWALMQMARGRRAPVYLLDPNVTAEQTGRAEPARDFERTVALLRESSPEAFRLAVALSPGAFTLPVARLVQEARFGAAQPQRLAEVLLSGLVEVRSPTTGDIDPNEVYYEFHPEARAVLLRSLRQADANRIAAELEQRVSEYLRQIEGRSIRFRALVADEKGQYDLPAWAQPFARMGVSLQGGVQDLRTAEQRLEDFRRSFGDAVVARAAQLTADLPAEEISLDTATMDPVLWQALRDSSLVRQREDGSWTIAPEIEPLLRDVVRTELLRGIRILWVDDQPKNNLREIGELLRQGATVDQAESTSEALGLLQAARYDLVLSDMSRPEGDEAGLALLRRLMVAVSMTSTRRDLKIDPPAVVIYALNFASVQENRLRAVLEGAYGCTNLPEELAELVLEASGRSIADPLTPLERVILERIRGELASVAGLRALVQRPELILVQPLDAETMYRWALSVIHAVARSHLNHLILVDGDELPVVSRLELSGRQYPHTDRADGSGLIGRAAREGATVWVPNVKADPHYLEYESTTGSELVLAVKTRGSAESVTVGVVNVEMDRVNGLTHEEIRWLERFVVPLDSVLVEELRQRRAGELGGSATGDPKEAVAQVNVGKDDYAIVAVLESSPGERTVSEEYRNDASTFADWLRRSRGGALAAENMRVLIGDAVTLAVVENEMDKLLQRGPGRRLYIYLYVSSAALAANKVASALGNLLAVGRVSEAVRRVLLEAAPLAFDEIVVLTEYHGEPMLEHQLLERVVSPLAATKRLPRLLYVHRSVPAEPRLIPLLLDALEGAITSIDSRSVAEHLRKVAGVHVALHGEMVVQPARASVIVILDDPSPAGTVRIERRDGSLVAASRLSEGSARFILVPGAYRAVHLESDTEQLFEITRVPDVVEVILRAVTPAVHAGRGFLRTRDQVRAAIQEGLGLARTNGPPLVREALARWERNPSGDVSVEDSRGAPMVSVSEGGLASFEGDETLKDYTRPNHLFADLFGGVRLRWPIVLFLSEKNSPGAKVETIREGVSIISLGRPYSLFEITSAYDQIMALQEICLVRAWFLRDLRLNGIADELVGSLHNFVSLPRQVREFVSRDGARLVGAHTLLACRSDLSRDLDLHALAESLAFDGSAYRVLDFDARGARLIADRMEEASFPVEEIPKASAALGLRALFARVRASDRQWRQLDPSFFEGVETVVVLTPFEEKPYSGEFPVFRGFRQLEMVAELTPYVEQ